MSFPCALSRNPIAVAFALVLFGCGIGPSPSNYTTDEPFRVGTVSFDSNLPPEPRLPTDEEVCATLEASNRYVRRPDGALPPEADPTVAGVAIAATPQVVNPDQARIQAALDACGAAVDAEVGAAIAQADAEASAAQKTAAVPNVNISGASGEELAKPKYRGSKYAVRLVKNSSGPGNSFISGPLTLPSGVTLWIDKDVTLYATRDVMAYSPKSTGPFCGNTAVGMSKGSSGNCLPLIGGSGLVNSAVMGDGSIDSRAYAELVTTNRFYPLMKVDLTCSNTYEAYKLGQLAPDGTACDNGGTVVNSKSPSRNMTWWDLAFLGNMVENGRTGTAAQSCFRMMVFNYVKNLTLYRITMNNSANFHFVPLGIDGLTVWGVKLQTPTQAAYANPIGNPNPLYNGDVFNKDNVKNTDAFDPGSAGKPISGGLLMTGSTTRSKGGVSFDGYLKNVVFAYNFVSTGDDDIVLKGSNNPSPVGSGLPGVDGNRDVRSDRAYGIIIAHNHIYWGHGISIGSETNAGVTNVHVYDNSFDEAEEGLRIKSDYGRGGEVSNIFYDNICIRNSLNALLYTAYYSTKDVSANEYGVVAPRVPNFHDLFLTNVRIIGSSNVKLMGFQAGSGGFDLPAYPLGMTLRNVVADSPDEIAVISADANLTLKSVNLPIAASPEKRVVLHGEATKAVDPSRVVDCSWAFVDFPSSNSPDGTTWAP